MCTPALPSKEGVISALFDSMLMKDYGLWGRKPFILP